MANKVSLKISVIVPVYNADKYLRRCIESVIMQTYKNWELILVDDGSTDSSAVIIDEVAKEDNRIIAIHQINAGAGEARNAGISSATGEYVVFLDSDDYIDKDYFSLLLPKASENDVVFIDLEQVDGNGKTLRSELMSTYRDYSKEKFLRSQITGKISWGGVRKAVSLKLLKDNNIKYTSHTIGEEALYSFRILYVSKKIGFLDEKPVYFYVNHEDSLSRSKTLDPWGAVAETMSEYLKENGLYREYADTVNAFRCTAVVVSFDKITQFVTKPELQIRIKERMSKYRQCYDTSAGIDLESMSYKAKLFVPFIKLGIIFPVVWCSKLRRKFMGYYRKIQWITKSQATTKVVIR
ncbi:glycosyltransferase family 2 protein [Streptococcus suis]|uniref:glycosyltransferase family 2 protein n=1 Tax=Streptococcus suis TaxID=1307 RepID=UPI003F8B7B34